MPLRAAARDRKCCASRSDVVASAPERRHLDAHHVDAVVEILAEALVGDVAFEIAIGRGDDPRVERHFDRLADRAHVALLQGAQELGLHAQRHLADLVEKQRAAVGFDEQALARGAGIGERAARVSEQLAFEQSLRNRRTVDRQKRPLAAAAIVDRPRDQLLAGAAFAGDQHARVALGDT